MVLPHLCSYIIMPTQLWPHDCARTWLCPDTFVPRHIRPQHELWPGMIITMSTWLCVNLNGENTSILNYCWRNEVKCDCFNCFSAITSSIPFEIFRDFIFPIKNIAALVWLWFMVRVNIIMNMDIYNRVLAQSCMGTMIVCEYNHVWAQSCGLQ